MSKDYTVKVEWKGFSPNVIVSARTIEGVDLAQQGGFALLGSFCKNSVGANSISAQGELPMVVTMREPKPEALGLSYSESRFALLFIPPHAAIPSSPEVNFSLSHNREVHVKQSGGLLFGQYFSGGFTTTEPTLVENAPTSGNPFYQVAEHLVALQSGGYVQWAQPGVQPPYYRNRLKKVYKVSQLPNLPPGWQWGPEVAGVMTVKKNDDPYNLHSLTEALTDSFEWLSTGTHPAWKDFLDEQAELMIAQAKSLGLVMKMGDLT